MSTLATVTRHLELEEIFRRYRDCECVVEKVHWQVIWLRSQGKKTAEVAELTGFNTDWIRRLIRRYNALGPDSLGDRRKNNGNDPILSGEALEELRQALTGPAPDGGLWNSPKVAKWMSDKLQMYVSIEAGRVYLHKLGMTLQTPRPRSAKATTDAQDAFKKKLPEAVADIREICPEAEIEVWAQDEARLGLVPILRRMWAPRGKRPIAIGKRSYEWSYLYGFVHPESGRVEWLIMPTVSQDAFEKALEHFANAVGASETKRILLVIDGAGWHRAKDLKIPTGIHPVVLPPYSPELQPSERLWPLIRESVANKTIETLDELEDLLVKRCNFLDTDPNTIKSHTLFHWWPKTRSEII